MRYSGVRHMRSGGPKGLGRKTGTGANPRQQQGAKVLGICLPNMSVSAARLENDGPRSLDLPQPKVGVGIRCLYQPLNSKR